MRILLLYVILHVSLANGQQCSARQQEPPICPQFPSREGIKYIGTENGLQRYTCAGEALARLVMSGDRTVHAKYVECNSTYYRAASAEDIFFTSPSAIVDLSCRNYGKLHQACSVPYFTNAFLHDGWLRCKKGFYASSVSFVHENGTSVTLKAATTRIIAAQCDAERGWYIVGSTGYIKAALSAYVCSEIMTPSGCAPLAIAKNSIQYSPMGYEYYCMEPSAQSMEVVTPAGAAFYGYKLTCENKAWKFTGVDTVTIPASSKVSCKPLNMGVFPPIPPSLPLVPVNKTPEGLTRWMCVDSTVTLDIEFHPEEGKRMPVHAAYIDANNTFYRFSSSIDYKSSTSTAKILSISCTDMGSKHSACSDPWDIGGIRKGNRYDCMKGFALNYIKYVDAQGAEVTVYTTQTYTKSMECTTAGWKLEGTALTGLRVPSFHCYDVSQHSGESACAPQNVTTENYKLQYDYYRKYFTCGDGTIMGYNITSAQMKKMYCGKSASGGVEWKWSFMDGSDEAPIPLGSKMNCF